MRADPAGDVGAAVSGLSEAQAADHGRPGAGGHRHGASAREPTIALAQALQFELMLRQKDVIGEWVPIEEDGEALLVDGELKWTRGLLWERDRRNLILRHQTSKTGKPAVFDLKLAPMVMPSCSG
jgi:hypothetical protein